MAFIPEYDENSEDQVMNVLANQSPAQPQDQIQQGSPSADGSQPTAIGAGQAPIGSQAGASQGQTQGTRKTKGSGMFTNVAKYIKANKPSTQRMTGALQKGVQKRAGSVAQQMNEQKDQLNKRYQQQTQQVQQAQQAGQSTIDQASKFADTDQLKARQGRIQSRIGALGQLQEGGYAGDITGYQGQLSDVGNKITNAQTVFDEYQPQLEQSKSAYTDVFNQYSNTNKVDEQGNPIRELNENLTFEQQDQLNKAQQSQAEAQAEYDLRKQALEGFQGQQTQLQGQLGETESLQEKYLRQQQLQQDLAGVGETLGASTGTGLSPEQLQKFRDFSTGKQTFDLGTLKTQQAQREADLLASQGRDVGRADVRKQLLKSTFGGADYTRGATKLDELLLARSGQLGELGQATKGASESAKGSISDVKDERALKSGMLGTEAQRARDAMTGSAEAKMKALQDTLAQRASTGESGRMGELMQALQSPEGLSQAQLSALGIDKTYGLDAAEQLREELAEQKLTGGDVATSTERARMTALNNLLGRDMGTGFAQVGEGGYTSGESRVLSGLKERLQGRQKEYEAADKGVSQNILNRAGGGLQYIADQLSSIAKSGRTPSDAELRQMQSNNYWAFAGQGIHGMAVPIAQMKHEINQARAEHEALKAKYNPNQALASFQPQEQGVAVKDGGIRRRLLEKLYRGK
jgi:hypothetical protein